MSDDFISTAKRLLRKRPVNDYAFEHTRRHRRLVVRYAGKVRSIVFPTSSSDSYRGIYNFRADLSRVLDALNVPRPVCAPSTHCKRQRCAARRPFMPSAEKAPPPADWHAALVNCSIVLFGGVPGVES